MEVKVAAQVHPGMVVELDDDSQVEVRGVLHTEDGWIVLQLVTGIDVVVDPDDELFVTTETVEEEP